jgi:phosphoglycerol transferase MdoB-like AlkP superfamily enzyme
MTKKRKAYLIFIALFFVLNIYNTYYVTTINLNRYIAPFQHTFLGEVNAFIGNFAVLFLVLIIGMAIFKTSKSRMIYLTSMTFLLNILIFLLGVFTLFFGTAFSAEALMIFNNPAEGFASSTVREIFHELFYYYRIVVFLPSFILLGLTIRYSIKKYNHVIFKYNLKTYLIGLLSVAILLFSSSTVFMYRFINTLPVTSTMSSFATQNYGVYPYYLGELFGIENTLDLESILEIETDEDLAEMYNAYNKNQDSYINYFDGQSYSNILTTSQTVDDLYIDSELSDSTTLNGMLENKNLILIHLESFNYFLIDFMAKEAAKGNSDVVEEAYTFLMNIFNESFVFNNIYNNVGMGVSSDAELAVLTGVNPTGNQTLYWDYNETPYELDSLVSYFNNEGYYTEAIHGDAAEFYNRDVIYEELYGFDGYYSIDDFVSDGSQLDTGYLYNMAQNLYHVSPWISDYELADHVYQLGSTLTDPFFLFPITMMGHTPYDFGPYEEDDLYPDYTSVANGDIFGITDRYIKYAPYYSNIIQRFFIGDGNTDQTLDDTVYIFYSDHGSDLKNGDISTIFDTDLNLMQERQMLQQIVSFIYVPSSTTYVDYGDYQLRKGLLTGTQDLVRSEIDLYRTIIELFGLDAEGDIYFGVNGLSVEPTFALENRVEDVVLDNYVYSMRNTNQIYPSTQTVDDNVYDYILKYKLLSDYMLTQSDLQNQIKEAIKRAT